MPEVARATALSCCRFWDKKRMHLHACVVMPDHVHMLLTPLPVGEGEVTHSLSVLLHSIKSYSANQINGLLGRTGAFWLDESYDRIMRSDREFIEKWNYIRENALRRELVDDVEDYPYLYEERK
jgi:REP element-mobilizing transposase RayT